jgi:hypothetical protein
MSPWAEWPDPDRTVGVNHRSSLSISGPVAVVQQLPSAQRQLRQVTKHRLHFFAPIVSISELVPATVADFDADSHGILRAGEQFPAMIAAALRQIVAYDLGHECRRSDRQFP